MIDYNLNKYIAILNNICYYYITDYQKDYIALQGYIKQEYDTKKKKIHFYSDQLYLASRNEKLLKEIKENNTLSTVEKEFKRQREELFDNPSLNPGSPNLPFSDIWQFCQFVRYAEKISFYNNDIDRELYVDSALDEMNIRKFKITPSKELYNDVDLLFELQRKNGLNQDKLEIIKIKVCRHYGKNMLNEYTVINGIIRNMDESDSLLINVINQIIYNTFKNTFNDVIDHITKILKKEEIYEYLT